jgi:hypothetical protein
MHGLELIGEVNCSGIATSYDLYIWKDKLSDIVFWTETNNDDVIERMSKEGDLYGYYEIFTDTLEQFCAYIMAWTPKYRSCIQSDTEKQQLCDKLRALVKRSTEDYYFYASSRPKPSVHTASCDHDCDKDDAPCCPTCDYCNMPSLVPQGKQTDSD